MAHSDVLVVGAGLAGLTTARELTKAGLEVRVLEARDRVGGRTLNHVLHDGQVVEAGGQFVGPTQQHVLKLAADLGIDTFPSYDIGKSVYVSGGSARAFTGDVPPDLMALPDIGVSMMRLNRAARQVPVKAPWDAPNAKKLDSMTTETWARQISLGRGGVELLNVLLASAYGATAAEASALFTLWYVAGAGDEDNPGTIERMIGVSNGAQESRFVGGSQRISELMADELGDRIVLSRPVRSITQADGICTVTTEADTWTSDAVVVAVPPHLAVRVQYDPPLPPQQDALYQRMGFGTLMKCEAVFDTPFWRAEGLSGQGVFRDPEGPICSMFDNTPPSGAPGVLLGFVGADAWRRWADVPGQRRQGAVLRAFAKVVGRGALRPTDYFEQDWTSEEWTRGGPTAVPGPGVLTSLGRWRDRPHGKVRWAGAEHADHWNGFMDGAVRSGKDAAAAILQAGAR